jgi:ribonuclease-3
MPAATKLAEALGLTFSRPLLLEVALTHRSFLNEHPEKHPELTSNERLEFLGDSIINMLAATCLYHSFPDKSEGELTELRAALVRTSTLAAYSRAINLGAYLRLSKGERSSGARQRDSLLADAFEALLGAIYLDQGMQPVQRLLEPLFEQQLQLVATRAQQRNFRSTLQERMQAERNETPRYHVVTSSGPDHQRQFTVEVLVGDQRLGTGQGVSKQAAAQQAAQHALAYLDGDDVPPH